MTPSNLLYRDYAAVLRLHHSLPFFGAFELKVSAHKFRIPQKGKDRKTPTICTSPTIHCNPDRFLSAMDREEGRSLVFKESTILDLQSVAEELGCTRGFRQQIVRMC